MTGAPPGLPKFVPMTGWQARAAEPCPYRGQELGDTPGGKLHECSLPEAAGVCTTGSSLPRVKACGWCFQRPKTMAQLVPLVPPAPPRNPLRTSSGVPNRLALDCVFRGEFDGETIGTSRCGRNGRQVNVYPCEVHGACTVEHTAYPEFHWCRTCHEKQARRDEVRVLVEFPHGLGDVVQFGVVLRHLRRHRPEWLVDVRVLAGRRAALGGSARRAIEPGDESPNQADYDRVMNIGFPADPAKTKTVRCLRELSLPPVPSLFRYRVAVTGADRAAAEDYLRPLGRVLVAHHKGHTAKSRKDLADSDLVPLADECLRRGVRLLVLDFDGQTAPPLAGHPAVTLLGDPAFRTAGRIAALKGRAVAWVGIDSGPGHVGGAVDTPGVVCWHGMDPRRYYDPHQPFVTHLVPPHLAGLPDGYREQVYQDLAAELPRAVFGGD